MSERGAQTLLDGLVGLGLVEVRDGVYRNTAEASAFLVAGRRADLSGYAKLKFAQMDKLATLPEVFRAGGPVQTR